MESFALTRFKLILRNILFGAICCSVAFALTRISNTDLAVAIGSVSLMPLIEEIMKASLLMVLIIRRKIRFLAQCLIYGAAVGCGFSILENIIYFCYNPNISIETAVARGFGCSILHIGCTAIAVSLLLLISRKHSNLLAAIISLVLSSAVHLLYNRIMLNGLVDPFDNVIWISGVFMAFFLLIYIWDEKSINKQMEISLGNDIRTLSAIKSGDFSSTKAGKYLLDLKSEFAPEVYSDMVRYLQLGLEVRISKHSDMLLHQAGLPNENAEKRHDNRNMNKKEMKTLARRIGKTGLSVIEPLLKN